MYKYHILIKFQSDTRYPGYNGRPIKFRKNKFCNLKFTTEYLKKMEFLKNFKKYNFE